MEQPPGYWNDAVIVPFRHMERNYNSFHICGYDPENVPVTRKMFHFPVDTTRKMFHLSPGEPYLVRLPAL